MDQKDRARGRFANLVVGSSVLGLALVWLDLEPQAEGDTGWIAYSIALIGFPLLLAAIGLSDLWPRASTGTQRWLQRLRGVVAILCAVPWLHLYVLLPPQVTSRTAANVCKRNLREYVERSGLWPSKPESYCEELVDGWGRPIRIEVTGPRTARVGTLGRDGQLGGSGSRRDLWWPLWDDGPNTSVLEPRYPQGAQGPSMKGKQHPDPQ